MITQLEQALAMAALAALFDPYRAKLGEAYSKWLKLTSPVAALEDEDEIEVVCAPQLQDPLYLKELIRHWGAGLPTQDLKVAASLWCKSYNAAVFVPLAALITTQGISLASDFDNLSFVIQSKDKTGPVNGRGRIIRACFHDLDSAVFYPPRCSSEPVRENLILQGRVVNTLAQLHQIGFSRLFREHFEPFFALLHEATGVSQKILWGNLGALVWGFYHLTLKGLELGVAIEQDRNILLELPGNPWIKEGKNPLYRQIVEQPVDDQAITEPIRLRATCCLWYKVPEVQMCLTCPLEKPEQRLERWKIYLAEKNKS
jgi:ferric iron reductase protein FhuF